MADALAGVRALVGEADWSWPDGPWLRANMVSSVDGSAVGADGLSGGINNAVDKAVFHQLRAGADAILVGAGTARAEGYGPAVRPLVVIGRTMPPRLVGAPDVRLLPGGGPDELRSLVAGLRAEGHQRLLTEGGPTLLRGLLEAGLVDELCLTITPSLVAGAGPRILDGPPVDVPLTLSMLVEADGTLLSRWLVSRS